MSRNKQGNGRSEWRVLDVINANTGQPTLVNRIARNCGDQQDDVDEVRRQVIIKEGVVRNLEETDHGVTSSVSAGSWRASGAVPAGVRAECRWREARCKARKRMVAALRGFRGSFRAATKFASPSERSRAEIIACNAYASRVARTRSRISSRCGSRRESAVAARWRTCRFTSQSARTSAG